MLGGCARLDSPGGVRGPGSRRLHLDQAPNHLQEAGSPDEERDLLGLGRLPAPLVSCCDTLCFLLVTLLLGADIATDLGVMALYVVRGHYVFLAVSAAVSMLAGLVVSVAYTVMMRREQDTVGSGSSILTSLGCLLANCPLQAGLLVHRMNHVYRSGTSCCASDHQPPRSRSDLNKDWIFIKLDLIRGVFNCAPQIVINLVYILEYNEETSPLFLASVTASFLHLLLATVLHEKLRKERSRGRPPGVLPMLVLLLYRGLVLAGRLVALAVFTFYFGGWLGAVLAPHLLLVAAFFTYLYRQVWRVPYHKILTNTLYCLLAYYPIHCEYRPEGEIVMYYIMHLVENIFMVGLPYFYQPTMPYTEEYKPWSDFHTTATLIVLLFSAVGLIFMGTYYFFFHGAKETISNTNLTWLAKVCEWTKRTAILTPSTSRFRVGLYGRQSNASSTLTSFSNPLCDYNLGSPTSVTQGPPEATSLANVTSPLWSDLHQYAIYPTDNGHGATVTDSQSRSIQSVEQSWNSS